MIAFQNNKLNFWQLTLTLTVFFLGGGGAVLKRAGVLVENFEMNP